MKFDLYVIGSGGTGTYFLKELGRFLSGAKTDINSIHIYDGDIVEEKNLSRQCFTKDDLGRNKASVMAEVLSDAFNVEFIAHPYYLTDISQISSYVGRVPILVSCVDNNGARLLLEKYFEKQESCILFDSGNEFSTGEVVYAYKSKGKVFGPPKSNYAPSMKEGDTRNVTEMSCEEVNHAAPQHILTNMRAGELLLAGLTNMLNGVMTPGLAYFDTFKYSSGFIPYNGEA